MTISNKGIALIGRFEGCRLTAYKCPAGVWTIGYGHTGSVDGVKVGNGMKITKDKATELLRFDCARFEAHVSKYSRYNWTQNEFDALVSFAYNVGNINGLTASGKRSRSEIAEAMLRYNKAGGKVLSGLTRRRQAERELFLATGDATEKEFEMTLKTLKKGDKGLQVKALQHILNGYGYGLTCDGDFGAKTEKAVVAYQKSQKNLSSDGIVGEKTYSSLIGTQNGR